MGSEIVNFIFLSELLKLPVENYHSHAQIGRILDLTATTAQVFPKITGVIVKIKNLREPVYIPWKNVTGMTLKRSIVVEYTPGSPRENHTGTESEILLKKTFLDKQIISTSGNKVVRVNDLHLLIDNTSKENSNLWLVHIDVGIKGLLRRLGWGKPANAAFKWLMARDIKEKFVSWKFVQPTATANIHGSLHVKMDSSKLSEIHPADIADILEDLGIDERISLVESLDLNLAAETLQEVPMKIRIQIAETLDVRRCAGIINEMHIDEAVDLLDEISPEQRNAVFTELPPEKVQELKDLSKLAIYSVGSIMNTDFIVAQATQTVGEVLNILHTESKKTELIYYIYILDNSERVQGVVTLRHVLSSEPTTVIADLMSEHVVSVKIDTSIKRVAQLFFKYNFVAIPVVDDENRLQGIVSSRDALESVFPEMKEESES
jgi:CBS domain-containing protein